VNVTGSSVGVAEDLDDARRAYQTSTGTYCGSFA
jgi:hypothetical protein